MVINIKEDGEGFLAEVVGNDGLYAFGYTEEEARSELDHVIATTIEIHKMKYWERTK